MPTINFVNEKKQVQVPTGANLRKEALKAGVDLYNGLNGFGATANKYLNCRGFGHCGTCRVLITKGQENAGPMGAVEKFRLKMSMAYIGHEEEMRLACRTTVEGDMEVVTKPPLNLFGDNFFS